RVCFAAWATSRSRRRSSAFPAAVIRLVLRRRSLESVRRTTNPALAGPGIRRVRSESRVTIRAPISVQDSPPRPAARRMRRTLYCDGESPAAAVTAVDRAAASHAARTSAISTSSSSELRIAMAAAGVGTDMGNNYSSRGVLSSPKPQDEDCGLKTVNAEGWRGFYSRAARGAHHRGLKHVSSCSRGPRLLTHGHAFRIRLAGRLEWVRAADIDRALDRRVRVYDACRPAALLEPDLVHGVPARRAPRDASRRRRGVAVRDVGGRRGIGEVTRLRRHQVAEVRTHGRDIGFLLRVAEFRDRDRDEYPDDHDHDQELDEREAVAFHPVPPAANAASSVPGTSRRWATHDPGLT